MKPQNPDVCHLCGKELGGVFWSGYDGKLRISDLWISHYKIRHDLKRLGEYLKKFINEPKT